jgi:(p)ppGpp synthase/HD superfamily hydrolase
MEDINCWQEKFVACEYSERLLIKLTSMNKKVTLPVDITKITKAIYYAKKYHAEQKRYSGEPYYSHPLEVAYMAVDYLFNTDVIIASILHDIVEDTEVTKEIITEIFGELIADQVEILTKVKIDKKLSAKTMIESAYNQKNEAILLIKLMDRLHNLETIYVKPHRKIKKITEETVVHFATIATALGLPRIVAKLDHLCSSFLIQGKKQPRQCFSFGDSSSRPLSLVLQNDLTQMKNIDKAGSL